MEKMFVRDLADSKQIQWYWWEKRPRICRLEQRDPFYSDVVVSSLRLWLRLWIRVRNSYNFFSDILW